MKEKKTCRGRKKERKDERNEVFGVVLAGIFFCVFM